MLFSIIEYLEKVGSTGNIEIRNLANHEKYFNYAFLLVNTKFEKKEKRYLALSYNIVQTVDKIFKFLEHVLGQIVNQ